MELCYLIAFPDDRGYSANRSQKLEVLKDAPYFQAVDIDLASLGEESLEIEGCAISITRQQYDRHVQMVEARYHLQDPFAPGVLQQRIRLQHALQSRYVPVETLQSGLFEEYIILLIRESNPGPDEWIEGNALEISRFIRSQREELDSKEIEEILASRTRYSTTELTVVDWQGAVIISPKGDFQSDLALLRIGNYQLLRYRMIDQSIAGMLAKLNQAFFENRRRPRPTRGLIRRITEHKLEVMLDFERAEQYLLMIGDWYTSKLYEAIQAELYLTDWKKSVRSELDNLEHIVQTVRENFSLSWESLLDRLQMLGWVLLLIGYLYLYLLDAGWISIP